MHTIARYIRQMRVLDKVMFNNNIFMPLKVRKNPYCNLQECRFSINKDLGSVPTSSELHHAHHHAWQTSMVKKNVKSVPSSLAIALCQDHAGFT